MQITKICQLLHELDNQGTVVFRFVFGGLHDGYRVTVDHVVRGGES